MQQHWASWDPGVPLQVLHTEYASVAGPIVAFAYQLRERHDKQILVLIRAAFDGLCNQLMHNHLDIALTAALLTRPDIITARIELLLHLTDGEDRSNGR